MSWDIIIILGYFVVVFGLAIADRTKKETTAREYFLKSNTLRWPSIAFSTIATNIHSGHFLGMAGSAYLYGLAQSNFEINAVLGFSSPHFSLSPFIFRPK